MEKLPQDLVKVPKELESLEEVFRMPPRPHKLFWMYAAMGHSKRSLSALAKETGEKLSTLKGWHERYHWKLNAQKHDAMMVVGVATTFSSAIKAVKMRSTIAVLRYVESGNQAMMDGDIIPANISEYLAGLEILDKLSATPESHPTDEMVGDFAEDADFVEVLEWVDKAESPEQAEEVTDGE